VSADKMMVKAKGPVWHKKQKEQNIIPHNLRGVDRDATWSKSKADGWVYGHGTFSIVNHGIPVLGIFKWMTNSADESKIMRNAMIDLNGHVEKVCMDSKADDFNTYYTLSGCLGIQLLTRPRIKICSDERKEMYSEICTKKNKPIYKRRSTTVEPMQGLVSDIFELQRCWMRGNENNRWIFASMGIAVQMAQLNAYKNKKSTWNIKREVLGI
jgi:hypothetical protein